MYRLVWKKVPWAVVYGVSHCQQDADRRVYGRMTLPFGLNPVVGLDDEGLDAGV